MYRSQREPSAGEGGWSPGGVPGPGECLIPGGAGLGGAWSWEMPGPRGVVSQHALRQTPPLNRMTMCKNIRCGR